MYASIISDATAACRPTKADVLGLAIEHDVPVTVAWQWISEPQIALGVGQYTRVGQ